MITHYVMFRLSGGDNDKHEAASRFKASIEALPAAIPELKEVKVSLNENPAESWTMVLVAVVDSWDDLATYSAHPLHQSAVAALKPMIAERAAVDTQF